MASPWQTRPRIKPHMVNGGLRRPQERWRNKAAWRRNQNAADGLGSRYRAGPCWRATQKRSRRGRVRAPQAAPHPPQGRASMSNALKLEFAALTAPAKGVLVVFCDEGPKFGPAVRKLLAPTGDLITRAAAAERFKGKNGATLDIV